MKADGVHVFLQARLELPTPLTVLTLSSQLESLPPFATRIPTLEELVLPDFESNALDVRGMASLRTVCFSGTPPEGVTKWADQRHPIALVHDDGNPIDLNTRPAVPINADRPRVEDGSGSNHWPTDP